MNTELIDWQKETYLYVFTINSFVKFGITSNWKRRFALYEKEFDETSYVIVKKKLFNARWEAELIEQVMKWRLRKWALNGTHEWTQLPVQAVLDCMHKTIDEILPELTKHKYIHKNGKNRWGFYKQIADNYFDN